MLVPVLVLGTGSGELVTQNMLGRRQYHGTTVPRHVAEVYYPEFLDRGDFFSGNDDIADCSNSHAIFRFISHTLDELLLFRRHKRPGEVWIPPINPHFSHFTL